MGAAASLKEQFDERKIIVREKKALVRVQKWEKKYTKLEGGLVDIHEKNFIQLEETLPEFRKRVHKSRRKLRRAIPSAEVALDDALDTFDYITDLRERLVEAAEQSAQFPHGLNPPIDLREDILALESGNPYTNEWKDLNASVQKEVATNKAKEAQWCQAHIKQCTGWLKKIKSLTKKMEINLEIGKEGLSKIDEVFESIGPIEEATVGQLRKLDVELEKAEATLRRLKQERATLESAKQDRLLIEAQRKEHVKNIINRSSDLLFLKSISESDAPTSNLVAYSGRRKMQEIIKRVVLQVREGREIRRMSREDFKYDLTVIDVEGE